MILTMENYLAYEGTPDGNMENQKNTLVEIEISLFLWKIVFNNIIFYTKQKLEKIEAEPATGMICNCYYLDLTLCMAHFCAQ